MEPLKSWLKPLLVVVAIGALLIAAITWLLLSKAKNIPVPPERFYSENGAIMATDTQSQTPVIASQATPSQQPEAQTSTAPQTNTAPPPPPPGGNDGGQPPPPPSGNLTPPVGAPSAQSAPDSQSRNQLMRASMKERIEKTAPEDRARMIQLRIEEAKYRQSHGMSSGGGGGGGGRGRGPGG